MEIGKLKEVEIKCKEQGVNAVLSEVWAKGGDGGIELAKEVLNQIESNSNNDFTFSYNLDEKIEDKINDIAKKNISFRWCRIY